MTHCRNDWRSRARNSLAAGQLVSFFAAISFLLRHRLRIGAELGPVSLHSTEASYVLHRPLSELEALIVLFAGTISYMFGDHSFCLG